MSTFAFKKGITLRFKGIATNKEIYGTALPKTHADHVQDFNERIKADAYLQRGLIPVYHGNNIVNVPFITGTALKARLRHAAADQVIRTRAAEGNPLTLKQIYSLKVGQVNDATKNKEKADEGEDVGIDLSQETEFRKNHPVEDVYGLFHLQGKIAVSLGIPRNKDVQQVVLGGVRHELNPQYVWDNLNDEGRAQYEERRLHNTNKSLLQDELKELEKQYKAELKKCPKGEDKKIVFSETATALKAKVEEKEAAIKALKDSQGGMGISTQLPIPARFVTPAGTEFEQNITLFDLSSTTPSSILIHGLNALSKYPKIGAHKGAGGEFEFEYEVIAFDDNGKLDLGKIKIGGFLPVDTEGLNELGKSWWDQAVADTSWHNKA